MQINLHSNIKIGPRDEAKCYDKGKKLIKQVNKNINEKVVEHIVWWCKKHGNKCGRNFKGKCKEADI